MWLQKPHTYNLIALFFTACHTHFDVYIHFNIANGAIYSHASVETLIFFVKIMWCLSYLANYTFVLVIAEFLASQLLLDYYLYITSQNAALHYLPKATTSMLHGGPFPNC